MIIKNKPHIPLRKSSRERILPVIPVKSKIILPGQTASFELKYIRNIALAQQFAGKDQPVVVVLSPAGDLNKRRVDLCQIGCMANIKSMRENSDGSVTVIVKGIKRIALQAVKRRNPYFTAKTAAVVEKRGSAGIIDELMTKIKPLAERILAGRKKYADQDVGQIDKVKNTPGKYADKIAGLLDCSASRQQKFLDAVDVEKRLKLLARSLATEVRRLEKFEAAADRKPGETITEQMLRKLRDRVRAEKQMPHGVRQRCMMEIDRLALLSNASVEYGATRQYVEWLLSMPWTTNAAKRFDLQKIEDSIDRHYYGSQKIKKKVLERIAIRKLTGNGSINSVLCLAGVPGTGKASLAKAMARAMGKEFIRISVGGLTNISDIKGSVRTSLGAMPGIIIRTLKNAGSSDPVVLIEDIEYFGDESATGLAMTLMEAIDPRYNDRFVDNYIGFPIDLSNIFFICAVKSSEEIPDVVSHRLEVIELPGYIEKEKIHIARKYIIPTVQKKHGLLKKEIVFSERGLQKIIRNYTLEAGLLHFKRQIEIICRHIAKEKASGVKKTWMVNEKTVGTFLGTSQYTLEKPGESPEIGVAIGLAWTGQGGDLMLIEGLRMKGSGEVITTGSLGEVMKESIQAAHSYVRSKADVLGIDHADFDNFDIHIHFPSGAIPKDGPSAGVAVSLVIASVMAERPIRNDIAMTGEVTLRGKVLQVGGLIEKISAAYRAGIPTVFIPKDNKRELKDLPPDILKKTKFVFIDSVDDIFARGLMDFMPSSYTLEKLFAEELKKAKNRKKSSSRSIAAKSRKKK